MFGPEYCSVSDFLVQNLHNGIYNEPCYNRDVHRSLFLEPIRPNPAKR